MDPTNIISGTGIVPQSGTQQNLQNSSEATTLVPATNDLQPHGTDSNNLNTSSSTAIAIPLDSITTTSTKPAPVVPPESSHSPYLISFGAVIIVLAIIGLVASNIIANRRLSIE